jgi:circadian clock protein KaiB
VKTAKTAKKAKTVRKASATRAFEKTLAAQPLGKYVLRLYVAGATERSKLAVMRARQVCEAELKGNFELQVIDVYQQPILARDGQILATPTLVREFPRPVRRLIGNLSNTIGLLVGLDLGSRGKTAR